VTPATYLAFWIATMATCLLVGGFACVQLWQIKRILQRQSPPLLLLAALAVLLPTGTLAQPTTRGQVVQLGHTDAGTLPAPILGGIVYDTLGTRILVSDGGVWAPIPSDDVLASGTALANTTNNLVITSYTVGIGDEVLEVSGVVQVTAYTSGTATLNVAYTDCRGVARSQSLFGRDGAAAVSGGLVAVGVLQLNALTICVDAGATVTLTATNGAGTLTGDWYAFVRQGIPAAGPAPIELAEYVPNPELGTTGAGTRATSTTYDGASYTLARAVRVSNLVFRNTTATGGGSTIRVHIFQTPSGGSGIATRIATTATAVTTTNTVWTATFSEGLVTFQPGIIYVLFGKDGGGNVTVNTTALSTTALLTSDVPNTTHPLRFTTTISTALLSIPATFNPLPTGGGGQATATVSDVALSLRLD